jgi:hypothetical protein
MLLFKIPLPVPLMQAAWASAYFFPGEGKIFQEWTKTALTICLENNKKENNFSKKSKNILFLVGKAGRDKSPAPPPSEAQGLL